MQAPLSLTFRHLDSSPALAARVRELADRLDRVHNRILRCEVVVSALPASHRNAGVFAVRVEVTIPGGVINANSLHAAPPEHADVYVALRDTFDNIARQLQDDARTH